MAQDFVGRIFYQPLDNKWVIVHSLDGRKYFVRNANGNTAYVTDTLMVSWVGRNVGRNTGWRESSLEELIKLEGPMEDVDPKEILKYRLHNQK